MTIHLLQANVAFSDAVVGAATQPVGKALDGNPRETALAPRGTVTWSVEYRPGVDGPPGPPPGVSPPAYAVPAQPVHAAPPQYASMLSEPAQPPPPPPSYEDSHGHATRSGDDPFVG